MGHLNHQTGLNGFSLYPVETQNPSWEQWYHKYSPIIYGIILQLAGNKTRAGRILKEVIIELTRLHEVREGNLPLVNRLIFQQTYNYTLQYLHRRGMKPVTTKPFSENFPLLNLLYFDFNTVDEVANKLNQTKQDVLRGLRDEFRLLRNPVLPQSIWATST